MNDQDDFVSQEREELLRNLLEQPDLEYCHERYPGTISLLLVRRTRAVLKIRDRKISFHLSSEDHGRLGLQAEGSPGMMALQVNHPALWRLGFHIAAEAMLALRNGHKEYVRKRRVQKSKAGL